MKIKNKITILLKNVIFIFICYIAVAFSLENYSNYSGEDYIFKKKVKQYTDILDQAVAFIETLEGSQNQPEASTSAN